MLQCSKGEASSVCNSNLQIILVPQNRHNICVTADPIKFQICTLFSCHNYIWTFIELMWLKKKCKNVSIKVKCDVNFDISTKCFIKNLLLSQNLFFYPSPIKYQPVLSRGFVSVRPSLVSLYSSQIYRKLYCIGKGIAIRTSVSSSPQVLQHHCCHVSFLTGRIVSSWIKSSE